MPSVSVFLFIAIRQDSSHWVLGGEKYNIHVTHVVLPICCLSKNVLIQFCFFYFNQTAFLIMNKTSVCLYSCLLCQDMWECLQLN